MRFPQLFRRAGFAIVEQFSCGLHRVIARLLRFDHGDGHGEFL